jgi:membrane protease YdiL (CAAX protease family)
MLAGYFGFLRESKYLAGADAAVGSKIAEIGAGSPGLYVLLAVFYSVPHSFLEEYYWRWFVYGQLRRWLRAAGFSPVAAGLSGVAFALHHVIVLGSYLPAEHFWTATLFFSLCVAVGGAVWAWLYQRSGQLYAPWLSHLLIDAGIMLIGFDLCWRHWNP